MLKSMNMPDKFWGEAVMIAVYILNRAPTKSVVGMTSYEAWCKRKPAVHHLRTFGCVVHVKKVGGHISKLADRSSPMVFIGYESGSKAYRAYDLATKRVCVMRDVIFEEEKCGTGVPRHRQRRSHLMRCFMWFLNTLCL